MLPSDVYFLFCSSYQLEGLILFLTLPSTSLMALCFVWLFNELGRDIVQFLGAEQAYRLSTLSKQMLNPAWVTLLAHAQFMLRLLPIGHLLPVFQKFPNAGCLDLILKDENHAAGIGLMFGNLPRRFVNLIYHLPVSNLASCCNLPL